MVQDRFLYVISSENASKSMAFVFGGVQKHFDSTHLSRHSTSSGYSLQNLIICMSMQALAKSIRCAISFCLITLECSHSWCVCTVHRTVTGCDASHQVREYHSLICYTWMSQESNVVGHSKPHVLKKSKTLSVFWVPHSRRRRRTLSLAC